MPDRPPPTFIYGTAWKEDDTARLTEAALDAGFRAIDTANQRRHYHEAGVGEGLARFRERASLPREDLFLQTKYTFRPGQDHRLPYDPAADIATQVAQSFQSSLEHLDTDYLDSYVLHGPSTRMGLGRPDWEAWKAMEAQFESGRARALGVSNVSADQLQTLCESASVQPRFVQNRCFAQLGWDEEVRAICRERSIHYQGFSLLTANRHVLVNPDVQAVANHHGRTVPQVIFRFSMQVGMLPLTGTTDPEHMAQDLQVAEFELTEAEVDTILRAGL